MVTIFMFVSMFLSVHFSVFSKAVVGLSSDDDVVGDTDIEQKAASL